MLQQTVSHPVSLDGTSIHIGAFIKINIIPQPPNSRIIFQRTDLNGKPKIKADINSVMDTKRCVTIGKDSWKIPTAEHLTAVFHGLGIDNALVEVNGDELPRYDGGEITFAEHILNCGIHTQTKQQDYFDVVKPVRVQHNGSILIALPSPKFEISFIYHCPFETQFFHSGTDPQSFLMEIAPARTIAYVEQIDALRLQDLGLGGTADSVVLLSNAGYRRQPKFDNEMVRHKFLDMVGDLVLTGKPVIGHFVGIKSGHRRNVELIRRLIKI